MGRATVGCPGAAARPLPQGGDLTLRLLAACLLAAAACGPDPSTPAGLYHHQCARCHGVDGTGNPRAAKKMRGLALTDSEMIAAGDRASIRLRIAEGEGSMPPFAEKLSGEEIEVLVTYTLELAGGTPP